MLGRGGAVGNRIEVSPLESSLAALPGKILPAADDNVAEGRVDLD